ncbi:hypothetical protein [Microcoleus sp. Pol12B5]|uniref:hypothetical protein n=1 Tax=Microcoleus sp. Pol12B5 TaxID=3055396 RepID=UPI002FCFC08D
MSRVAGGITQASTALFFWSEAFNQIKAASSQFYNMFIGQNEKMRQQILATQSSLAAVQDVYINGVKSIDPTETIKAFEEPIKKSLNQIAIESLDLVGVTSGQLTDLLQIALTNATKITNQSKDFADPIKAAERLTLSFAGAFGAMQIPLFQARQEINSILSGTIDMNSRLAKGLSITNEQVRAWGAQGVLVDKLVNKLQPFVAGNALAARSVSGITSNIQEIFEITTRLAGENITALFVDGLDVIYQYMKNIQSQIQATLNGVTAFIGDSVKQIIEIISPFLPALTVLRDAILGIGGSLGEIVGGSIRILLNALEAITPVLTPILTLLGFLVKTIADLLGDPVIQQMIQMALIISTVIGPLTTIVGLVGTIYGFFASGGSIGTFFYLLSTIAPGLAGTLSAIGTALGSIAGFGGSAGAVAASGSALTTLASGLATVTAAIAPLAVAIAALASAALLWQSLRLNDSMGAIDEISSRSDETATGANDTTLKLRQLRDKEIIQGELTDKQKTDKKKLEGQGRNYAAQLEAEIAAAKEIDTAGDTSLENAKKALIAGNEASLKGLGKFVSGLSTSAKPLTELGGTFTQLSAKVAAFEAQIKAANSDPEFQTANKGIIELITKQVQLGQITTEQGKKRLKLILDDSRVELAGREAAEKAIGQIQEVTTKRDLELNKLAQSEIESIQNDGRMGEVKAEQMLTEEKLKEVKIRSDAQKIAHTERMRQIQAEMNAELGKIDKEIADKQVALDKLKSTKAPEVQIVQAQRELNTTKSQRTDKQSEFVAIQIEENRKNATETAKLDTEQSKLEKQQRDIRKREALKDFDERQKLNDSARDQGLKDNQQAAIESIKIAEDRAKTELSQIKDKTAKLEAEAKKQGKTVKEYDKEAWEALQVQQAEALQKLAAARKEGFEKRLSDIKQDAQEATAIVEAAQAKNEIDNQNAATRTAEIATKNINTQIALINKEIAANAGNKERLEELNAKRAGLEKDLTEVQKKQLQQRLSDLQQDADERVAVVKFANARGTIDNQEAAKQTSAIESASSKNQLQIIQARIAQVQAADKQRGKVSTELLEELRKQEADTQVKITEIAKKEMETRLADLKEDVAERTAVIKSDQATGAINNQAAAAQTAAIERTGAAQRLEIVRQRIQQVAAEGKKSGKVNVELMEALKKQEAEIQIESTEIDKKEMDARLSDLQQDADERLAVVQKANALGVKDNQQTAIETSQIQQKSANEQIKIVQERINTVVGEGKKSGKVNTELLEELRKKEADLQVKITEIQKQELQKRLADLQQNAEERTSLITAANATGVLDNQESAKKTAQIQREGLTAQLGLIRQRIETVSPANKELLEELKKQEADTQVKITEIQKQELQKRLSDLQQDGEERLSVVTALNAKGDIDNQATAVRSSEIQKQNLDSQLALIQGQLSAVGGTNKELREELLKQEADIQVKITEIQKQELQKRLSDLRQDSQERVNVVEAAAATGAKNNQRAATEIEDIQRQSVNNQLDLVRERIAATSPLNKELNEELKAQEANLQKELTEIQEQGFQKRLSDLQQDEEERLAVITANGIRGLADNQETALKSAAIQEESAQQQLTLIRERLGQASGELREKLLKQEADTQSKIAEIRKQAFDKRLADVEQDGQEQQTILEGQLAQGLTTEAKYAESRYNQSLQSLDAQLVLIRERRSQMSATDIEGQEALAAQEASLQKRRQDALSQFLEAQLSLLDRENKKATDLLEQSELDRKLITKQAALSGVADKDAAATAEIQATQRRIQQEIALEEQKNATLRSLPAFSDPAKEAERQSRIRASVKKTTELRLQLLDEEKKAFDLLVERQIKSIQNQSRAQELASDVQVRAIEQQGKQYDLLGRSLENQNKLLQSRASLANALNGYIQGEYKILQDSASSEGERKRLIKEAADAQLVALQQQQIVAQKNLEIEIKQAEIAQKRAESEAEIAEIRARSGLAKADAEVLKAEATLQKVQRDPNASNADVEAARLDVVAARAGAEAAVAEVAFAIANKEMVGQNRGVLEEQNALKRETQSIEQATQGRAAQAQAIEAIVDPNEKKLRQRQLAGRLTPEETERLARIQRQNQEREAIRRQNEAERDALRGISPNGVRRGIQSAGVRSGSLLGAIEQTAATAPKVPELKNLIAQMNVQRQQISVKPEINPLTKLQEESTGYQREMLGVLKQINQRPTPAPVTPVANNFNIKAEAGISEAQVLGVFGQVSQQVTQMLKR